MTAPTASNFPTSFDDNTNLFVVHDALRLRLLEDYNPGDTSIYAEGDATVASLMPSTGIITLTEQCSEPDKRAISFHYGSFDSQTLVFTDLDLLEGFEDLQKPKRITNITINVVAPHHNHLKNALINIEEFIGIKGTEDIVPFGDTLEGRINFIRRLVLQPKAWFSVNKRIGNVPLEIEFKDMSFRLGTEDGSIGPVTLTWNFGDQSMSIISLYSLISATDEVPDGVIDVLVRDMDGQTINKTYFRPGLYDVSLTVANDFGSDTVTFPELINARTKAPNSAIIHIIENTATQEVTQGVPVNGPFEIPPKIRSPINTLIELTVKSGENPATPGYSYAGEMLDDLGVPIDSIDTYTWSLGDDLSHPNNSTTKASYSVGGIYDMKLRTDTEFGAYRITTYEDSIDIIENTNLWLWTYQGASAVRAYEYGLISETYKLTTASTLPVIRNDSFLDNVPNETGQKQEFERNVGFAPRSTATSGGKGASVLFWATGRNSLDPPTSEEIAVVEFSGFTGTYITRPSIQRQWNWLNLNALGNSYFMFGTMPDYTPNSSYTNTTQQTLELTGFTTSSVDFVADNFLNGADELTQDVSVYDLAGESVYGNYSVYRGTWLETTGYFARNDGVGPFFRIKNFYRTEGIVGSYFMNIRKMQDIQGPTKLEGNLVSMISGVFFLNNSGAVSKFLPTETIWQTGGPGVNSILYRSLQDTSVTGFDDLANTMLCASDLDHRAYMSFDYSENTFIKFNEIDLTFSLLGSRPAGQQFLMGVY